MEELIGTEIRGEEMRGGGGKRTGGEGGKDREGGREIRREPREETNGGTQ